MGYTPPTTRVTGELMTATIVNTDYVDNIIYLEDNLGDAIANLNNGSGGTRSANDLVVRNAASDNSFTTSTTANDPAVAGVVIETINNGATGRVQVAGLVNVATTGTVAREDHLGQSGSAGVAQTVANDAPYFGIAMTAGGPGADVISCLLQRGGNLEGVVERSAGQVITPAAGWVSVIWTTERIDTFNMVDLAGANTRITVQKTGVYQVNATVDQQGTPGACWFEMRVLLNGSAQLFTIAGAQSAARQQSGSISGRYPFTASDYIELQIDDLDINNYTIERCYMSMRRSA